ncbi:MAG TPA: hypothetical protein HPP81_05200 [Deltaproteobacteria bacterium]|jgi:chromosome segregation ATPase|nr:hypothetical protein [Deltaproteobacteria bacterium]HIJ76094.1 hypothetical protein [Deltaproteobacteria bacterium]
MVKRVLKEKQDSSRGERELIKGPVRKAVSEVEEEVKEVVVEEASVASDVAGRSVMPEIKGPDILKEGIYSADLEKTISDMFSTIKNMEVQLERVLNINTHLERDLKASREMIGLLKTEKSQLEKTIAQLENEIPSKRELQIEIDHLVEERNAAQSTIRGMKVKLIDVQKTAVQLQERLAALGEEKQDAISEINFLEARFKTTVEKIKRCESEITLLKGEKLAQMEKMRSLEEELSDALTDKYKLFKELKESKDALAEIGSTLVESKLQAKKSFYKAAGSEEQAVKRDE